MKIPWTVAAALGAFIAAATPCSAQQSLSAPPGAQNPGVGPQGTTPAPSLGAGGGVSGTTSPATTTNPAAAGPNLAPSPVWPQFGTVGQGLPGMLNGPPVNGPMGARDPSTVYMRPAIIGPLSNTLPSPGVGTTQSSSEIGLSGQ
jgi:hypothetical protein